MSVTLDLALSGTLYADQPLDEYFLDVGYALGTGLVDYDPVLADPDNQPNPGLAQFDAYSSWNAMGFSFVGPTQLLSDSVVYSGVIGDSVQILLALSSFSYSNWGYTWTDATLDVTVTAVPEPTSALLLTAGLAGLAVRRRARTLG